MLTVGVGVGVGVGAGAVTLTETDAEAFPVTTLFAVTTSVLLAVTFGAVSNPALEIVPAVVYQVTPVLVVPVTVAVNCRVEPDATVEPEGETRTEI